MGFNLGAFASGFAQKATEIETESARIGMELLKDALDDFREEAKNYGTERDKEIQEFTELAGVLDSMMDGDSRKVASVLRRGKTFTTEFIKNAQSAADEKGYKSVADLVKVADSFGDGPFDTLAWIKSGAPLSVKAPTYVGPGEMKTAVFNRDISYGGQGKDSVEQISRTYIGDRPEPIAAPTAEIELYPVPGTDLKDTDRKRALSGIEKKLAEMAGISATIETLPDGTIRTKFSTDDANAKARIGADALKVLENWESSDKPTFTTALGNAQAYAAGMVTDQDQFYKRALQFQSVSNTAGGSTMASTRKVQAPETDQPAQQAEQGIQGAMSDPDIQRNADFSENNKIPMRTRHSQIKGIAKNKYGLSDKAAEELAKMLLAQGQEG